ncbi:hypothetical protein TNCT_617431 [Trichonephila clavata]|uniref:Uncharacterized protein n=1 Tax=Trichonephila clavata TaxID=2740835 RepID=A0A8X6KZA5_TRICU|nr:hypothetical protein TNCT_617431 [Trichonephila clavata]
MTPLATKLLQNGKLKYLKSVPLFRVITLTTDSTLRHLPVRLTSIIYLSTQMALGFELNRLGDTYPYLPCFTSASVIYSPFKDFVVKADTDFPLFWIQLGMASLDDLSDMEQSIIFEISNISPSTILV